MKSVILGRVLIAEGRSDEDGTSGCAFYNVFVNSSCGGLEEEKDFCRDICGVWNLCRDFMDESVGKQDGKLWLFSRLFSGALKSFFNRHQSWCSRCGRRLFFSDCRLLSVLGKGVDAVDGRVIMQQSGKSVSHCKGTDEGMFCAKAQDSFSSVFASGLDTHESALKWKIPEIRPKWRTLEGSYTVEASLVMSITLFFIAALLSGVFAVHSRVIGNFVLQEMLEQCVFSGDSRTGETADQANAQAGIEEEMEAYLNGFFSCSQAELRMERAGKQKSGWVRTSVFTEISVKEYEPEDTPRLWAVLQSGIRRKESGSSLQERDEP